MNITEFFNNYTGGNNNVSTWTQEAIKEFAEDYHRKQLNLLDSCEKLKDKNKTGFIGCEDATKKDSVVLHNVDFSGKCFKCGKQVWERQIGD